MPAGASVIKCPLAQEIRVDHAFLRERNDSLGEYFGDCVGSIRKSEGCPRHFEGNSHNSSSLRIEAVAVQKLGDGHDALLAVQAGARPVSQPPTPGYPHLVGWGHSR